MFKSQAFSGETAIILAAAGGGAIVGSMIQRSIATAQTGLGDNLRDLILVVGAAFVTTMGGGKLRAFGLGMGAVAVGSLIQRNVITTV
jgi:hypothetical protein